MKNKKDAFSCDWQEKVSPAGRGGRRGTGNTAAVYRHKGDYTWRGIHTEKYKKRGMEWADIIRRTLIGNHGETAKFHVRYFEIAPGGYSSLERHRHEHVIIGIRGKGICIAGKKKLTVCFLDTIYIDPNTPHQLKNMSEEPFGFLCIVNAKRDCPTLLG
jgi:ribulose-bisphosphate carboxylase large chain